MNEYNKKIVSRINRSSSLSLLKSRNSIEDLFKTIQSQQNSSLQSDTLISRLNAISNKEGSNEEPEETPRTAFVRKRNRSRSTLVVMTPRTPPLQLTNSESEISNVLTRARSNSDPNKNDEKKNSFFFRSNSSKIDKYNTTILESYDKIKSYYKQELITPLELLSLKFYIRSIEPKAIKFYDKEPNNLKKHELALFQENDVMYCKLYKLNKFAIVEHDVKSYNRFKETISCLPDKNNYCKYLENYDNGNNFKISDVNKGDEILASWDKEKLFNYLTIQEYTMKENVIYKWPKIKTIELIDKIRPKELLDKFWKSAVTEILSNEEYLYKVKGENVELLISSIIFLLGEITNIEQIKHLKTILIDFYKKLIIIDPYNENFHYEYAKYSTSLELYVEAWNHIHKCDIVSHSKKDDIIWLKQLKMYYLSHLMKRSARNDVMLANDYINIGHFTKAINELEGIAINKLEIIDHFLQGLIHLYYYDENLISIEIAKWSHDIIFMLSCSSYCRSDIEKNNEICLLNISLKCLELLNQKPYVYSEDCLMQVSKINIITDKTSKNIILTKTNILSKLAKLSSTNELSFDLHFKCFQLLSQTDISIKEYYSKYENIVIESITKKCIELKPVPNISLLILAEILIERKYNSDIYLLILNYFADKELWISAYKLNSLIESIEIISNLSNEIKDNYIKLQDYKKNLSDALLSVIDYICNDKESSFLINNWLNECYILTNTQHILIDQNKNMLKILNSKFDLNNFRDLEKMDFNCKLYEFFGIPSSEILWIPEKFIDPTKFIKLSITNNDLRKSNGDMIDEKMIESVKKMLLLGKSTDDIAFFFNIPIITINKILSL